MSKSPFKDATGSPFLSPLMKRIVSVVPDLTSPKRKPRAGAGTTAFNDANGKNGGDIVDGAGSGSSSPVKISPVNTPKGRAGLRSPARRAAQDANMSALRRAYRTQMRALRKDDDGDNSDTSIGYESDSSDPDEQDLAIAERIIQDSRRGEILDEEDLDDEFQPLGKDEEEDDESEGEAIDSEDIQQDDEPAYRSRYKGVKIPELPPQNRTPDLKERKHYGPSDVLSIFNENSSTKGSPRKGRKPESATADKGKKRKVKDDLFQDGKQQVPFISGIPQLEQEKTEKSKYHSFNAFPLPPATSDNHLPQDYINDYLPDINWENSRSNDIVDNRAYFSEGPLGFFDQMSNREKHSVYLLSILGINLENQEFSNHLDLLKSVKRPEKDKLFEMYQRLYHQWSFELSQGFNICYYGVGSKIDLITDYVSNYLVLWIESFYKLDEAELPKVLVLNGYNPAVKLGHVLEDLVLILIPPEVQEKTKIPKSMGEAFPIIVKHLQQKAHRNNYTPPKLILVVHCLDAEPIRDDRTQVQLSLLASMSEVRLICSIENVGAPLIWDTYKAENFKFIYHDITTYEPYLVETSYMDVINLGRTKRSTSRRGVKFVLSALNTNSKKMYKILVDLQLENIKTMNPKSSHDTAKGNVRTGVEFKHFHQKCIEQFITANEINFRSMLGEFIEHNMCKLTKDETGKEKLFIPLTIEEMTKILRDSYEKRA